MKARIRRTRKQRICKKCIENAHKEQEAEKPQKDTINAALDYVSKHKLLFGLLLVVVFVCCVYANLPLAKLATQSTAEAAQTILYKLTEVAMLFVCVPILVYVFVVRRY